MFTYPDYSTVGLNVTDNSTAYQNQWASGTVQGAGETGTKYGGALALSRGTFTYSDSGGAGETDQWDFTTGGSSLKQSHGSSVSNSLGTGVTFAAENNFTSVSADLTRVSTTTSRDRSYSDNGTATGTTHSSETHLSASGTRALGGFGGGQADSYPAWTTQTSTVANDWTGTTTTTEEGTFYTAGTSTTEDDGGGGTITDTFDTPQLLNGLTTNTITIPTNSSATITFTYAATTTGGIVQIFSGVPLINTVVFPSESTIAEVVWIPPARSDTADSTGYMTDIGESHSDSFTVFASDFYRSGSSAPTTNTVNTTQAKTLAFTSITYSSNDFIWSYVSTSSNDGSTAHQGVLATGTLSFARAFDTSVPTTSGWSNLPTFVPGGVILSTTRTHQVTTTGSTTTLTNWIPDPPTTFTSAWSKTTQATETVNLSWTETYFNPVSTVSSILSITTTASTIFSTFTNDALNADGTFWSRGRRTTTQTQTTTTGAATITGWAESPNSLLAFGFAAMSAVGYTVGITHWSLRPDAFISETSSQNTYYLPTNAQGLGSWGTAGEEANIYRNITVNFPSPFDNFSYAAPGLSLIVRDGISMMVPRTDTLFLQVFDITTSPDSTFAFVNASWASTAANQASLAATLFSVSFDATSETSTTYTGVITIGLDRVSATGEMTGHSSEFGPGYGGRQYVSASPITRNAGLGRRRYTQVDGQSATATGTTNRTATTSETIPTSRLVVESLDRVYTIRPDTTAGTAALGFNLYPDDFSGMSYPAHSSIQ